MALGLESNIAETAKAFQGNPQALQQRYTQKQDLFDLLALNMIKKQQAAAKNQLLMSQQKMPGTIIEQTEGAVTKNASEAAAGVKGVLDTKNAQSKAKMNNMAGVASNPANNMRTLAGGGIVGFAGPEGSEVPVSPDILKKLNISRKDFDSLTKRTKKLLLESVGAGEVNPDQSEFSKDLKTRFNSATDEKSREAILLDAAKRAKIDAPGMFSQIGEYFTGDKESYKNVTDQKNAAEERKKYLTELAKTDKPQFNNEFTPIPGAGKMKPRDQSSLSGIAAVTPEITEKKDDKPVVPGVGVDSFSADKSGGAPAVGGFDASKFAQDKTFDTKVRGGIKDLLDSDPQKAVDFASRTPAEQAMIEKLFKERTDMRDNRMNPDKLSSDRLSQMLLGAKGATAGEAFRTAGLAGINADKNVENIRRSEFDAINKLFMTEADRSQGIKQKAFEGSQADKKQGVASGTSLTTSEKSAELQADKLLQDISDSKVKNEIQKGANKLKEQTNSILAQGNTIKSNSDMIRLYEGEETKRIKSLETNAANALKLIFGETKEANDKRNKIRAGLAADVKKFTESYAAKRKKYEVNLAGLTTAKTGGISEVDKILGIK